MGRELCGTCWAAALGFALLAGGAGGAGAAADEMVLLNGTRVEGQVLKEDAEYITVSCQGAEMEFPVKKIHALTVNGKRRVLNAKPAALTLPKPPATPAAVAKEPALSAAPAAAPSSVPAKTAPAPLAPAAPAAKGNAKSKSRVEVEALIGQAGQAPPDWWNSVKLTYPPTLDLTWQKPPQGSPWDTNKWLGQYIWSVVNENASKWKEGVRLLHHTLTVNKSDPAKLRQSMNALGTAYGELLQDWARAAYWWRQGGGGGHGYDNTVALARSYWNLGCKEMATEMLAQESSPGDDMARLWSDLGEYDRAIQIGEALAQSNAAMGNQVCGDICRQAGRFAEALKYYQKVMNALQGNPKAKNAYERAKNSFASIKVVELLDLKRIPDGSYAGDCYGYSSTVQVSVTVKGARIQDVKVTDQHEKQFYASLTETPARILEKQGIKGVDAFSSATITSEAIINATAKALGGAMK